MIRTNPDTAPLVKREVLRLAFPQVRMLSQPSDGHGNIRVVLQLIVENQIQPFFSSHRKLCDEHLFITGSPGMSP